jgi:hypothetical protein
LFVVSGALRGRQGGERSPGAGARQERQQLPPTGGRKRPAVADDDDLADIEAILRKRGIT